MNKTTRRLGVVLAAAAGLACAAPAAFAVGTFTVTAGSAPPGTVIPFHAVTTGTTPQIHFTDTTANVVFTCDSGTAAGTLTTGTGLSGIDALTINGLSTTWSNCQGAGFNFNLAGSGNWPLNATSGSSSGASGNISNVNVAVTGTGSGGSTCNFTIAGSAPGNYTNTDTTLHFTPGVGLSISGVSGTCGILGIINNGDLATFRTDYVVTADNAAYNPIHFTQP